MRPSWFVRSAWLGTACAGLLGCASTSLRRLPAMNVEDCPVALRGLLDRDERLEHTTRDWLGTLPALYPRLSAAELKKKTVGAPSSFRFFRALAPLFYERIETDPLHAHRFASLKEFRGWMHGDAHPENFGVLLARDGSARFAANDIDDAGEGLLYLDALRFLTAARYVAGAPTPEELLEVYRAGLRGEDFGWGAAVEKILRKSEDRGFEPRKNAYDPESGRLVRSEERVELADDAQLEALRERVSRSYGGRATLRDAVEYRREWGGSGFQKRFVVLLEFQSDRAWTDDGRLVVELKQMVEPATQRLSVNGAPTLARRLERSFAVFAGDERGVSPFYQPMPWQGLDFQMRPRYDGEQGVDLADWEGGELHHLLRDEMLLLGRMHRRELGAADARRMAESVEALGAETWAAEARHLHTAFTQMYRDTRP
jgi:hypothetical protein